MRLPAPPPGGRLALAPGAEVVIHDDGAAGLARALAARLAAERVPSRLVRSCADLAPGPVAGLLLLGTLDDAPAGAAPFSAGALERCKEALRLARALAPRLRAAGTAGGALLATVARLDGAFGHAGAFARRAALDPLAGGLAGLAKTARQEWPEVRCRALDAAHDLAAEEAARLLLDELRAHGPLEVGLGAAGRAGLSLRDEPAPAPLAGALAPGDLVVVSGGARGVTAACAVALARAAQPALLLLGRTPIDAPEPPALEGARDEAALKRALLESGTLGARPTPRALGEAARGVLAAREARETLARVRAAGAPVLYRAADVRDPAALAAALSEARALFGPVRALVHGAGVIQDRRIEDKTDADIDLVLDVKLAGLSALLEATAGDDLRAVALFSSGSGRFGRRGQADYALANQALASLAQRLAARRPGCRAIALEWGPWEGGMVTPALRREFERERVELIPLEAGAAALTAEMLAPAGGPAAVVLGAGLDAEPAPAGPREEWTLALARRIDPASHPVLADHVLAGKPVLPLALSIAWCAEAARRAFAAPALLALEDVRVQRGVVLEEGAADVSVFSGPPARAEGGVRIPLELRGGGGAVHVRASALLGEAPAGADRAPALDPAALALAPYPHAPAEVYGALLFHGPRLRAIEAVSGLSERGIGARLRTAPPPPSWTPGAAPAPFALDPLVIDGVFQALILWCRERRGAPSLPSRLGAVRLLGHAAGGTVEMLARVRQGDGSTVLSDVEVAGADGRLLLRLEGYACTASPTLERAFGKSAPQPLAVEPDAADRQVAPRAVERPAPARPALERGEALVSPGVPAGAALEKDA